MAAIEYFSGGYATPDRGLVGRHVADAAFLRALVAHGTDDCLRVLTDLPSEAAEFERLVRSLGSDRPVRGFGPSDFDALREARTLYRTGPTLAPHAWHRAFAGHAAYSLCGITHTVSEGRIMEAIADWVAAPLQPWDAIVCTSNAVRDAVRTLLRKQQAWLRERLGATRFPLPRLPVIPLGVHSRDFAFDDETRRDARQRVGADAGTVVVLFVGRRSYVSKAHPLAMYQALGHAAAGRDVLLLEFGQIAAAPVERAFEEAAVAACPQLRRLRLDGGDPALWAVAWSAADVFCSLADNLQESFGLTPLEAMSAGLPVVVSDWDGYRDTVRDGVDGFRVPTLMPPPASGPDLAWRHARGLQDFAAYSASTAQFVAVDVDAAARALRRLIDDPALRRAMGDAGRARARAEYDWSAIIARYEALWRSLDERRATAPRLPPPAVPWPSRLDPFTMFARYPTRTLRPDTLLRLAAPDAAERLARWRRLEMVAIAPATLPDEPECAAILARLSQGPATAGALAAGLPATRRGVVFRGLAWLVKLGVVAPVHTPRAAGGQDGARG